VAPTCKIKKRWFTTDFIDRHNLKFGVDEDGAPHEPEAVPTKRSAGMGGTGGEDGRAPE